MLASARDLARHWGPEISAEDFAQFVAECVLADVSLQYYTRQELVRWERRIRRDEQRRLGVLKKRSGLQGRVARS
jgi:hypothetical protein